MKDKINSFFKNSKSWNQEMKLLREIILKCNLEEEFKWMHPCYTYNNNNVVLIHSFNDYCALLFFKGVLMLDKKKILFQQTPNVQDRRQLRFTSIEEIQTSRNTIIEYLNEAIAIEKSEKKVAFKKTEAFEIVEEFMSILKKRKDVKQAFDKLTPGRQRGYLLHFSAAKLSATRIKRIEFFIPKILLGKGKDD